MNDKKINRIDALIQFSLLCAGEEEEWTRRRLGRIHLIKYVYLADYHYALTHGGQTYTGLPWRFYKFGPWQEVCFQRLESALTAIGADRRTYSNSKYEDDSVRWTCSNTDSYNRLYEMLPLEIVGPLSIYVHKFGGDTESLLDFVYKTAPMLTGRPNQRLDFEAAICFPGVSEETFEFETLTRRQQKKQKEKLDQVQAEIRRRLDRKKAAKSERFRPPAPRYDDVYFEGLAILDRLAGDPITSQKCIMEFSDDVWKSKARYDSDLP